MRSTNNGIEPVVDLLHEAALEPSLWSSALEALSKFVGQSSVSVLTSYHPAEGAHLLGSVRYDPENWKRVQMEHATPQANRYIAMLNNARSEEILWPRHILGPKEWNEDPITRKFLKPDRLGDGLTVPFLQSGGAFLAVGLFRGRCYDNADVAALQDCTGHIRRALVTSRHLGALSSVHRAALDTLDHLTTGVLLVDAEIRVRHANAAARSVLDHADGLALGPQGRLRISDRRHSATLTRLVQSATASSSRGHRRWSTSSTLDEAGGAMSLSRPSGRNPYSLLVAPLRVTEFLGVGISRQSISAVIFLSDLSLPYSVNPEAIASAYGLTNAEAGVVACLIAGHDLHRAALNRGISINTAKTLLQRVFERTHTRRQADLISLILRGPTALTRGIPPARKYAFRNLESEASLSKSNNLPWQGSNFRSWKIVQS